MTERSTAFATKTQFGVASSGVRATGPQSKAFAAALGAAAFVFACGGATDGAGRSPLTAGGDSSTGQARDSGQSSAGGASTGGKASAGGGAATTSGGSGALAVDGRTCLAREYQCSGDSDCCSGYCADSWGVKTSPGVVCQRVGCARVGDLCQSDRDCCAGGTVHCGFAGRTDGAMGCFEYGH